jgi:RNA polymerase sigma factor (sigma-70 family)
MPPGARSTIASLADARDVRHRSVADLARALRDGTPREASRSCAEILVRFDPLFRKYWGRLRPRLAPPAMEYQDFVQEIALKLLRYVNKVSDLHAFPGYLHSIVASTVTEVLRRSYRTAHIDPTELISGDSLEDAADTLVVRSFIEQLPTREALAVDLSIVQGLDSANCAQQLGLSESGFRTLKSRAIQRLRRIVQAEAGLITKT